MGVSVSILVSAVLSSCKPSPSLPQLPLSAAFLSSFCFPALSSPVALTPSSLHPSISLMILPLGLLIQLLLFLGLSPFSGLGSLCLYPALSPHVPSPPAFPIQLRKHSCDSSEESASEMSSWE